MAWNSRPISNAAKLGASMQTSEPIRNTACVMSTMRRVSIHWMRPAVIGVNAPITSKKPVVSHCTVVLSIWKSAMILVSATLSRVSLR